MKFFKSICLILIVVLSLLLSGCGGGGGGNSSSGGGGTNTPPNGTLVANAGNDLQLAPGESTLLDASLSSSANGGQLSYEWSIVKKPLNSSPTLLNKTNKNPTFTPDVEGEYEIGLVVIENNVRSAEDRVKVTVVAVSGDNNSSLILRKLTTDKPSVVTFLFQAFKNTATGTKPYTTLKNSDFIIKEDDKNISKTESFQKLKKRETLPYTLYTPLMIDLSLSVSDEDLKKVTEAAKAFIYNRETNQSNLLDQQQVAIYVFSEKIQKIIDYTNDSDALINAIDSIDRSKLTLGISTNLYGAVREGVDSWTQNFSTTSIADGVLLLLTDGADTASITTLNSALQARGDKKIVAVGIGSEIDSEALQQLGNEDSFLLNSYDQLGNTFPAILQNMKDTANSFYYIYYASPKRAGEHTLELSIKDNIYKGFNAVITGSFNANGFSSVESKIVLTADKNILELGDSMTFTASSEWVPDGSNYVWELSHEDGISYTIDDSTLTLTADSPFQPLTVKVKNSKIPVSDSRTITYLNIAPNADAGNDQTMRVSSDVTLDASDSNDTDGTIVSYEWKSGQNILSTDAVFTTSSLPVGVNTIVLTVTDDSGATDSDSIKVTVTPNIAPNAAAGNDQIVRIYSNVTLDASDSNDTDGTIVSYEWKNGQDILSTDKVFTTNSLPEGVNTIVLTVTDNDGATDNDSVSVTVTLDNPLNADAGSYQRVTQGDSVTLDASNSSDGDGDPLSYLWSFETKPDDSNATLDDNSSINPTFVADSKGKYVIKLVVSDQESNSSTTTSVFALVDINQRNTSYPGASSHSYPNAYAFAALKDDGSVVTWGDSNYGGDSSSVSGSLSSGVKTIYSTGRAFAGLKTDGSVVTWGDSSYGGDSSSVSGSLSSGVKTIYSTHNAFAALKNDGSVVTWGFNSYGGDSSSVSGSLSSGVKTIYSTYNAFAALKNDGSVVTWGDSNYGGDSSSVSGSLSSGVKTIYSTGGAVAALKDDGSVVTWGFSSYGGDSSSVSGSLSSGVKTIYSTHNAFAALKNDGSVVTWGDSNYGGDSSSVSGSLSSGVKTIYSTNLAFAALKTDGSVVTWGYSNSGGDSSSVSGSLNSGVKTIYSTGGAVAALKDDGSVVTWGFSSYGGDSSSVSGSLSSGVKTIYSTYNAFAALKNDGSVVTWGDSNYGGDSSSVSRSLSSGVKTIYSTGGAVAALKDDGSVVTWGFSSYGGDSSSVSRSLSSGVKTFSQSYIWQQNVE